MTEPRSKWMPPVPGPLQRIFDHFPLTTYPANDLPSRSPVPSSLPTLYVWVLEEDARRGWPSFNPSCLKWQTFLRIAGVRFNVVSSSNHASPTGALPFLLPPNPSPAATSPYPLVTPIPSTSLRKYALTHGRKLAVSADPSASTPQAQDSHHLRQQAYQALLDGPIRAAWLHTLYLTPDNAALLASLYVHPSTSSTPVRAALLRQLRLAASAEIALTSPSSCSSPSALYAEAAEALEALASLLGESPSGADEEKETLGWFFGRSQPGEFDAAVFAYTQLLLGGEDEGGLRWGDPTLAELARSAGRGELVRHRRRIWDSFWSDAGSEK